MKTLFIFRDSFCPNSAAINRLLAFVKGFSELGVLTNVVFIRPNEKSDKSKLLIDYVNYIYLWEGRRIKRGKYFQYFQQVYWIFQFLRKLKEGDNIVLFGTQEYFLFFSIFRKFNFYYEINEHPDIGRNKVSIIWNIYHKLYLTKCKSISGIFVISTALKKYFCSIGVSENKIHIINMITDYSRFNGLEKKSTSEKFIAYCGSITIMKDGVDILIKAFKKVLEQIPDLTLWIIGSFPFKEDKLTVHNLIDELSLNLKVIFPGVISTEKMPQVLKNAEALVLARPNNLQAKNGFPTKLGEYLLSETPVIVTDVGDIGLFLKNEESAFIAEPGSIDDLSRKICSAVLNRELAENIGRNGRAKAMEHFNYIFESCKICNIIFNQRK